MHPYHTLKDDLQDMLRETDVPDRWRTVDDAVIEGLNYKAEHVFPDTEALIRIAGELGMGIYRVLALTLKAHWERDFSSVMGWKPQEGDPLMPVLARAREQDLLAANFNPDTLRLFEMFENRKKMASRAGYTSADFDTLAQQMILSGLHRARNNGPELYRFTAGEIARIQMLDGATPEHRQAFWSARCRWTQLQETLDGIHVQTEARRLRNAETRRAYLALFGKDEVALQEAIYHHFDLRRRKMLKEANPDISEGQLSELVIMEEERHRKQLEELEFHAMMASHLDRRLLKGAPIDFDSASAYKERAKKLLRQLKMKIHTDHLQHDPAYCKLSGEQKRELELMLREALCITFDELGFPPDYIEHNMRSVPGLEAALAKVDAILRNAGVNTRIEMVIQGNTVMEQLAWLKQTCISIEHRIESARAELHALAADPEVERMGTVLDCPDKHEEIQRELRNKTNEETRIAKALKMEIDLLFK